ncbi:MAG: LCP family protein [Bacilli bacterium]|nr:LCP family protein [Bacilli bacterium]
MKSFLRKLKKRNKVFIIIYLLLMIAYIVSSTIVVDNILNLTGIETTIRLILIIFIYFILLIYFIFGFLSIMDKRKITFIIMSILLTLLIPLYIFSSAIINNFLDNLHNLNKDYINYKTVYIKLNNTTLTNDSKIGMINIEDDIEGYILPKEYIKKKHIKQEIAYYDDYLEMLYDLYSGEIDSLFITHNYVTLYKDEENLDKLATETTVIDSYQKKMKNNVLANNSKKSIDEPFSILLMGVDSTDDGLNANMAYNGDTLMLITFNPETLNATVFSIPRDMYVPIACRNNAKAKINSSAAHGTECVINTVQNFTEVKVDYYVKINFRGVVDLVDALGGVTIDVGKDFCEQDSQRRFGEHEICLKKGVQKLNGEQALAYARHRHTLLRGDIDRIQNQQQVVEAIAKEIKEINTYKEFESLLNTITKNMLTNMTTDQILSFYNVGKDMVKNSLKGNDFITIDKTYLEYYDLPVYLKGSNTVTSALGYYTGSLDAIKDLMKNNLSTKDIDNYIDFNFETNTEYKPIVTGKGITKGKNDNTMPKLIGKTIGDAQYYVNQNGLILQVEYQTTGANPGTIINQSIRYGSFINKGDTLIITVEQ